MQGIPLNSKISRGAYSNKLYCPFCSSTKWKFIEKVTPTRIRYQCKKCGHTIQYDITNNLQHPYSPYKKNKWRKLVEKSKT